MLSILFLQGDEQNEFSDTPNAVYQVLRVVGKLTNKVRLCERSEPQSEPFVGQARPVQRWSKNTEK
jgi:hypothetical protein